MKKAIYIAMLVVSSSAFANDTWLSIGRAPESEGKGTSFAIGFKGKSEWALQLGFIMNSEFSDKGVLDYPVPHNNYRNIGTKRTSNSYGLDVLYFFNSSGNIRPYIGVGGYYGERKEIAQSNVTGWYYTQSDKSKFTGTGEIGIQAKTDGGFIFGIGYHSLRGGNISLGKEF